MDRVSGMSSERRLLEGARKYDKQILTEIYDLYSDELYRYAMRRLGDADLAEECIAETFSRFLQALQRGKGPQKYLRAYLYRAAHNWMTNYFQRRPPHQSDIDELQIGNDEDLLDAFDKQQKQERIRAALAKLTPEQSQVVMLKYYEGWNNREVAEVIQKPVGSVKSLQHRALGALRRILLPKEDKPVEDESS
ncbi:RNA polymerase sigma factor [Chloroflexi bacterium TSY]|nr:RNA polymerase sigma factor [Chloroflexi bacterium TSY]